MPTANEGSLNPQEEKNGVDHVMQDEVIADFVAKDSKVEERVREAAKWLITKYPKAPEYDFVKTVRRLLKPLKEEKLRVFFSYRKKDEYIANQIAKWLQGWSAEKLWIEHMERLESEGVGRDWRQQIEQTIPRCDWFLLLLPSPGERDWTMYEAGYFKGAGHDFLGGRFVCLHHCGNKIADALDEDQSVPSEQKSVTRFLSGLFHEPNWIPGMPKINGSLGELEEKAQKIVDLIQGQASEGKKFCSGPHMEVTFEDASKVKGWKELAEGRVKSNPACNQLFGLEVPKSSFGEWFKGVKGAEQDEGWVKELAQAIQAAGEGLVVPAIRATFSMGDGRYVRPTICAQSRRTSGQVEAIDILFSEEELPRDTSLMKPELAALAITLVFAVRFRYQVLEPIAGRKIERKDVMTFYRAMNDLRLEAARDQRFAGDPESIREKVLASFTGEGKEDKTVIQKMYERWDQLWRPDGKGEINQAIDDNKGEALEGIVKELIDMFPRFLSLTSKRFGDLIAVP